MNEIPVGIDYCVISSGVQRFEDNFLKEHSSDLFTSWHKYCNLWLGD